MGPSQAQDKLAIKLPGDSKAGKQKNKLSP
jgi:hypothetical protein